MIEFSIRRPVSVFVFCLGLLVLGAISYQKIPIQLMPQMNVPEFKVVTFWKNATSEEIESQITIPIERAVSTVSGLKSSSAVSQAGQSELTLRFHSNIDIPSTLSELRDKVDGVALPEGVRKSKINRFQASSLYISEFLILPKEKSVPLSGVSKNLKETLLRELEGIDGLALAQINGGPEDTIEILVNPTASQMYGVSMQNIVEAIQSQNRVVQIGQVDHNGKRIPIRFGKLIGNKEELLTTVLKTDGAKMIRLSDLANANIVESAGTLITWNSRPALLVQVRKEAEANTVEVGERVRHVVDTYLREHNDQFESLSLVDQASEISSAVDNVKSSVISGAILAALIIYLLLQSGWTSVVISLAIPISLLISLILMYFTGVTFNLMSLAGLALGVGMLVDNSTIVLESIGLQKLVTSDRFEAALFGTQKVLAAIFSSTLSTVAVFAPLVFVEGEIGYLFRDVALTICYSIFASLAVATVVIPVLSTFEGATKRKTAAEGNTRAVDLLKTLDLPFIELIKQLPRVYLLANVEIIHFLFSNVRSFAKSLSGKYLSKALVVRDLILKSVKIGFDYFENWIDKTVPFWVDRLSQTAILVLLSVIVGLAIIKSRGAELFPEEKIDKIKITLRFPVGEVKENVERRLNQIVGEIQKKDGVQQAIVVEQMENRYELTVVTVTSKLDAAADQVASHLSSVPDLKFDRKKLTVFDDKKPIQILSKYDSLSDLRKFSYEIQQKMLLVNGIVDVENSLENWLSMVVIESKNQKMNYLGIDSGTLVSSAKNIIDRMVIPTLQFGDRLVPGEIAAQKNAIRDVQDLQNIPILVDQRKRIYLSEVATFKYEDTPTVLLREDRQRVSLLQANIKGIDLESAVHRLETSLSGIKNWRFGGQREQQEESNRNLILALAFSTLLIYLITASQFENLMQPLVVLIAIPLSIVGVGVFLYLFNLNFSSLVLVGFIILVGASVNTSIVMVDFANQLMIDGADAKTAILQAAKKRMRPIVVTTAANILGLVPMAFSFGQPGSSMQQPLSVTLIGGLLSSTILTIIAVPAFYVWIRGGQADAK